MIFIFWDIGSPSAYYKGVAFRDTLALCLVEMSTCLSKVIILLFTYYILHTFRKVIWDGVNAHVVLFGAEEGEIEYPDMVSRYTDTEDESTEEEPLEAYSDVDYGEFDDKNAAGISKTSWREDSKGGNTWQLRG